MLGAIAIAGQLAPSPPEAAAQSTCSAPRSTTLASTSRIRAYSIEPRNSFTEVYYACHRHTGRRMWLGERLIEGSSATSDIEILRLKRHMLALEERSCWQGNCGGEIRVVNVRTRRRIHRVISGPGVTDFALKSNGSFGYISTDFTAPGGSVWRVEREGRDLLDTGSGVERRSLGLTSDSMLRWRRDGQAFSAPLR
jgi:hypothetical protein